MLHMIIHKKVLCRKCSQLSHIVKQHKLPVVPPVVKLPDCSKVCALVCRKQLFFRYFGNGTFKYVQRYVV